MALDLGIFLEGSQSTFKVKVSENDAQAQFLLDKFISSDGSVTITETNDGGVEQINLTASGGGGISSPLTTKGDLFTYSTADARLGVGTDGQALLADSAEATGLKWGTISADNMATADLTLTAARTHDLAGFELKFDNGQVTFEGQNTSSSQTAILIQNSIGSQLLKIDNAGGFNLGEGNSLAAHDKFATVVGQGNTTIGLSGSTLGIYGYNNSLTKSGNLNNYTYIFGGGNTVNNSGNTSYITNTVLGSFNSQTNGSKNFLGGSRHTNTGNANTNLGYQNTSQGFAATLGVFLESSANYADVWGFGWSSVDKFTNTQTKSLEIGWEIKSTDTAPFRFAQTSDSWINGSGGLGVGTSSVDSSAQLDVSSTTKGFLLPRMTTTQKNAISSPASGLMVYDTTLSKLCVYTGAAWETITSV